MCNLRDAIFLNVRTLSISGFKAYFLRTNQFFNFRDPLFLNDYKQEPLTVVQTDDQVETEDFKILPDCVAIDEDENAAIPNESSSSIGKQVVVNSGNPISSSIITCTQVPNPNFADNNIAAKPVRPKKRKKVIFVNNLKPLNTDEKLGIQKLEFHMEKSLYP